MALTKVASSLEGNGTVVAIQKDKNSQVLVKWAVDNLMIHNKKSPCVLIHVISHSRHSHSQDSISKDGRNPTEEELQQFFLPCLGYCARKGVTAKEIVLHDIDIPSAIIDYIVRNSISNVVVGASHRNAFIKKFKEADVATSLLKSAPESCSVYVISKGKTQTVRSRHGPGSSSSKFLSTSAKSKNKPSTKTSSTSNNGIPPNNQTVTSDYSRPDSYLSTISSDSKSTVSSDSNSFQQSFFSESNSYQSSIFSDSNSFQSSIFTGPDSVQSSLVSGPDKFQPAFQPSAFSDSNSFQSSIFTGPDSVQSSLVSGPDKFQPAFQPSAFSYSNSFQSSIFTGPDSVQSSLFPGPDKFQPAFQPSTFSDSNSFQSSIFTGPDSVQSSLVSGPDKFQPAFQPSTFSDSNSFQSSIFTGPDSVQSSLVSGPVSDSNSFQSSIFTGPDSVQSSLVSGPVSDSNSFQSSIFTGPDSVQSSLVSGPDKFQPTFQPSAFSDSNSFQSSIFTGPDSVQSSLVSGPDKIQPTFQPSTFSDSNSFQSSIFTGPDSVQSSLVSGPDKIQPTFQPSTFSDSNSFQSSIFTGPDSVQSSLVSGPNKFQPTTSQTVSSFSVLEGSANSFIMETPEELEAEMNKLKLQLQQTMDIYNSTCNEATAVNEKLQQFKSLKERNLDEARMAEEAATACAEMERQKTRLATEASRISQRLADIEKQKRKLAEMKAEEEGGMGIHGGVKYRRYKLNEIELATDHFNNKRKIGEGGYGPVYKGFLDHTPVAIKILRPDISQGLVQFQKEVEVLSHIRHPNMVILVGACPEYGCLIYEYMDNGSLEDRLFCKDDTPPIPWRLRFKIASEIATALLFLHQTKPEPFVHRDLKPGNILLDRNYVSKISDVGLARLVPASAADSITQYHQTAAAGTFCYIDPEYQQTGLLGVKSDVYSLGVMLLQIITAKPPIGLQFQIEEAIEQGTLAEILDPAVTDWPVEEALSYAQLALKCCEMRKRDRPDLGSVVLPELNRLRDLGMGKGTRNGDSLVPREAMIDDPHEGTEYST